MDQVKCDSGIMGYRVRLQEDYDDFDDFEWYSDVYCLATRLGYESAEAAWADNPMVQGSVIPEDFRVVTEDEVSQPTERTD